MKKLLTIGLLVVLLFAFNCKKDSANKIVFWQTMNAEETATLEKIIAGFEQANPGVKIEMAQVPFDGARQKYDTAAQAGNAPDVFRSEIAWTPDFADKGYLADITDKITDADDYLTAPLNYCKYNDKLYGVPQVTDCLALLYNKRLLAKAGVQPPKTMDELLTVGKKLTSGDQYGFFMRGDSYWLQAFIWAFGGGTVSNSKQIEVNNAKSVAGVQFVVDTLQKSGIMPVEIDFANDYATAMDGFKSGKYAMILNGPWATADILTGAEFKDPTNLGVAVIPAGPDGQMGSPVGGHNYVISAKTKKLDLTVKFVNYLNNTENQVMFAVNNNLLPTRYSAYNDDQIKQNALISSFKNQLEVARNRPVIPEGAKIFDDFTKYYQQAWKHELTAQQAMDSVAKDWSEKLGLKM